MGEFAMNKMVPLLFLLSLGAWAETPPAPAQLVHKKVPATVPAPDKSTAPVAAKTATPPEGGASGNTRPVEARKTSSSVSILPASCEHKQPVETFISMSAATAPQAARYGGVYFLS